MTHKLTRTVLVVDDSLTVRMDLAEAFEAEGFHTIACADLAEARAALVREPVGLLVLDRHLPDGDGVDLLREVRIKATGAMVPALMLSGPSGSGEDLPAGPCVFVGKPYERSHVLAEARRLLIGPRPGPSASQSILIVDDSPTFTARLAETLGDAGYAVRTAANGREGLAALAARRPSAIIVDGVMPDMDGATLIRRVRLDADSRAVPCLLLTASDDDGAQLRALDAGADAFVRKDDDMDIILARLAAVLRRQGERVDEHPADRAGPRRILAVDDSLTYLMETEAALRREGYDVLLAHSGEEALDLLAAHPVDCILMDVVMPGIGGKEACRRIKAANGVRDIPLILLTAHDDRAVMLDGLSAGADDYISKAAEFEVLCARVLAQIRRKQFEDENRRYREQILARELEANRERAARVLAESRVAMVGELERTIEQRTRELEATIIERQHAERLASIGMLSASIAHEINNPLAVMIGNLEFVAGALDDAHATADRGLALPISEALEAGARVRQIVRDLRIFSRSEGSEAVAAVDAETVLAAAIRMASNEIRHRARLVTAFAPVPLVAATESRLGQVLVNLIANAAQAIPIGQAEDNEVRITVALAGPDQVAITISDTGVGIPADKLLHIFEPFFTTKPAGAGTGLGLAICQRIVTEMSGTISVVSTVGVGSTFTLVMPTATTAGAAAPAEPIEQATTNQVRGTVLVIDDEPALCAMIARILGKQHTVETLTSASAALKRIATGGRFDVILSDLMMPEMSGMELFAALAASTPDQAARMLFMSGGAFSPDAARFLRERPVPTIEKPFRPALVRDAVANAMQTHGPITPVREDAMYILAS